MEIIASRIAVWAIIGSLAAAGIIDIWLAIGRSNHPTVSELIHQLGRDYPIIILATGVLIGHLFWPLTRR